MYPYEDEGSITLERYNRFASDIADRLPPMPPNKFGLVNGTRLVANEDYPFFRLNRGDEIVILFDGKYIYHRGLTWSATKLCAEIAEGFWSLAEAK